jgi:hypothetical protein
MATEVSREELQAFFEQAAREYLASLPMEHFMEATAQARQREIFVESMAVVHALCPEIQPFNELLLQRKVKGRKKPLQVVPDNMVVLHDGEIDANGSYDIDLQPVGPLLVLEYVSKSSKRKDYDQNMLKYERRFKVPYYLLFQPEAQELSLYRHNGRKYVSVKPNELDRYPIPELEMEVAILDGWARFWFRGELLPLPADLLRELEKARRAVDTLTRERDQARQEAEDAKRRAAELERELEQLRSGGKRKKRG